MKKVFSNNRLILIAFFTVFATAASSVALANDSTRAVPVELKFIGNIKNQPLFQLNFFGTPDENEFIITIRDGFGNSLFREFIKGEVFSKKFLLNTEEMSDEPTRFEVLGKKSKKTTVFEVNRNTIYMDEMVVSTLK